ncbi:MAG: choice-of-anchor tandem repeat GloVer-containing protein, partial [Stenotrophobium sp.]
MTGAALYTFGSSATDGSSPFSLVQGGDGNFYGTTVYGGTSSQGAIFKVTAAGAETILHSFGGQPDGSGALDSKLIRGSDGNFYGVTALGGVKGEGTVFEVTPTGDETVLYSFGSNGTKDAGLPNSLVQGRDGNFYGTAGGGVNGLGAIFKIVPLPVPVESVVYSFG